MPKLLEILNAVAQRDGSFSSNDFAARYGGTAQSASNALARAVRDGMVDRVSRGRYAIRGLGALGSRASTESLLDAVRPVVAGRPHRIAYLSALDHHSLLRHPATEIQVAFDRPTRVRRVSGLPFHPIIERRHFLDVGVEQAGPDLRVSDLHRALIDAGRRPDLVGGVDTIVDALGATDRMDVETFVSYANRLNAWAALRRLGTIASNVGNPSFDLLANRLNPRLTPVPIDPHLATADGWVDPVWRIRWDPISTAVLGLKR